MITAGCIGQVYFWPGSAGIAAANSKFAIRNKNRICNFKIGFQLVLTHTEEISFSAENRARSASRQRCRRGSRPTVPAFPGGLLRRGFSVSCHAYFLQQAPEQHFAFALQQPVECEAALAVLSNAAALSRIKRYFICPPVAFRFFSPEQSEPSLG
jgi:hypothetical protein